MTGMKLNDSPAGLLSNSPRKDLALLLYFLCHPVKHGRLKSVYLSALYSFAACYMRFTCRPSSQGIMLDDIFSVVFFPPDGDRLDVSSDEDVGRNVTLSSISSSEGRAHTPFAQYEELGDSPDLTGVGGRSGPLEHFYIPGQSQAGEDFENSAWSQVRWHREIGERGNVTGARMRYRKGTGKNSAAVLTVWPKSEYPPIDRCSAAETTGGTSGEC